MTREPLVSVIVSVYNTEHYLDRCITSILGQSYRNIELIIVDDGSEEGCARMCDSWAERDCRVRVIHKHNEGLGMSRNTGIEQSSGEYICFVDGDDYVESCHIETALSTALLTGCDVVAYGFHTVSPDSDILETFLPRTEKTVYEGGDVMRIFLADMMGPAPDSSDKGILLAPSAWSMMYRRELIDRSGWRFVSEREMISEDVYSHLLLAPHIRRAAVCRSALYNYVANPDSLSRSYRADRHVRNAHLYRSCVALCESAGYPREVRCRVSEPYVANMIAALKHAVASAESGAEARRRIMDICSDAVFREVVREKLKEKNNKARRILFLSVKNKLHFAVYMLVKAKLARERR